MLVPVGYDNFIESTQVVALLRPDSAPVRKMKNRAAESHKLIDATCGHKTRTVIVLANSHICLCAVTPQTLRERLESSDVV